LTTIFHIPKSHRETEIGLPTFAVDISGAYTCGAQGTGFASRGFESGDCLGEDLSQSKVVDRIVTSLESLKRNKGGKVNLIVEAPLSYAVASGGSSDALLREIEKPASYPALQLNANRVRPWNCNAGASTALMALIFLTDLRARAPQGVTINLFEGFWSWGNELGKPKKHFKVALQLLDSLQAGGNRVIWLPDAKVHYRTALDLLRIESSTTSTPPPIVFGHEKLASAYVLHA
jgi:hypothetical protein